MTQKDLDTLFELRDIAIQGYDADRRVFYWNEASANLYGYTKEEAIGSQLEDLIIPDQARDAVISEINAWVSGELAPTGGALDLKRKDGTLIRVRSNHLALRDDEGRFRLFCIDLPMEQQVALEASLNALWPVGEAPDIWASALTQTGAGTDAGPDVRTPLNAVMAFCDTLSNQAGGAIETFSERMADGFNGELARAVRQNLALLGAAPLNLDPRSTVVPVQDVLIEVAGMVLAARSHHEDLVRVQSVPSDLTAFVDPFLLKHALAALVHFGVHNSQGRGSVVLSARTRQTVNNTILFSVKDEGPPIPDALRIRLLAGQAAFHNPYHAKDFSGLFYLTIVQRMALATGASLAFEEADGGTNVTALGVQKSPL